jgi:ACS family hexuronate transporter-like MFS transporter
MATTINYFDRVLGVMAPTLQRLFEWSNKDYAAIMVSFKIAYGMDYCSWAASSTGLAQRPIYNIHMIWSVFGMLRRAAVRPAFTLIDSSWQDSDWE